MSTYHVETTEIEEVDGVEKSTDIDKDITIDFSAANYTFKNYEDKYGACLELIPDNMDFLHELTDIFPLSEYDIKISQPITGRRDVSYVFLDINIYDKTTGDIVNAPENVTLSDEDYEHLRGIIAEAVPHIKWRTAEEQLIAGMRSDLSTLMCDGNNLLSDEAKGFLEKLVLERYKDFKVVGIAEHDGDKLMSFVEHVIENALRSAYESQK